VSIITAAVDSELNEKGRSFRGWVMQASAILEPSRTVIRSLIFASAFLILADAAPAGDAKSIKGFRDAIVALAPDVDPGEAELVSVTAHTTARRLAKEWRVVPPAMFQNFLIHIGARERGFCFHWAYGIGAQLKELRLKTLVLHWGAAYAGGRLEHNCVVVTARGQLFRDGYIIDGWRNAGRLCWWPVKKDDYPWKEDLRETAWLQNYGPSEQKAPQNATVQR
jgi:hypothetical protein